MWLPIIYLAWALKELLVKNSSLTTLSLMSNSMVFPTKISHGMLIYSTLKYVGCYLQDCPIHKVRNSFVMLNSMCGKILFFTSYEEMGFIEDACLKMRSVVSCTIVMLQPIVVTLDRIK